MGGGGGRVWLGGAAPAAVGRSVGRNARGRAWSARMCTPDDWLGGGVSIAGVEEERWRVGMTMIGRQGVCGMACSRFIKDCNLERESSQTFSTARCDSHSWHTRLGSGGEGQGARAAREAVRGWLSGRPDRRKDAVSAAVALGAASAAVALGAASAAVALGAASGIGPRTCALLAPPAGREGASVRARARPCAPAPLPDPAAFIMRTEENRNGVEKVREDSRSRARLQSSMNRLQGLHPPADQSSSCPPCRPTSAPPRPRRSPRRPSSRCVRPSSRARLLPVRPARPPARRPAAPHRPAPPQRRR